MSHPFSVRPPSGYFLVYYLLHKLLDPNSKQVWGKDEIRAKVITNVKFCKVGRN